MSASPPARQITTAPAAECPLCFKPASLTCTRCRRVRYCSKEHQKEHWKDHKGECQGRIMIFKGVNPLGDWYGEKMKKDELVNRFAMTLDFVGGEKDEEVAAQIRDVPDWILDNSLIMVPDLKIEPHETRKPASFACSATASALCSYARKGGTVAFAGGEQDTCVVPCLRSLFDVTWKCTEKMRKETDASDEAKGPDSIFGEGNHANLICRGAVFTNVPVGEGYWTCQEGAAIAVHKVGKGRALVFNDLYMDDVTVALISQLCRNVLGNPSS